MTFKLQKMINLIQSVVFIGLFCFSCSPALEYMKAKEGETLQIQFNDMATNYFLKGNAVSTKVGGTASGQSSLTEINVSLTNCSVKDNSNADNNDVDLTKANIIWNNQCSIKFNYLEFGPSTNLVQYDANPSDQILNAKTPLPKEITFDGGLVLRITNTNIYKVLDRSKADNTSTIYATLIYKNGGPNSLGNAVVSFTKTVTLLAPSIGAGEGFTCAQVYPNNAVLNAQIYCWGYGITNNAWTAKSNYTNLETTPNSTGYKTYPTLISFPTSSSGSKTIPSKLAVGNQFACILDYSGYPWCWGYLGNNASIARTSPPTPIQYDTTNTYKTIAAGYRTACGITNTGTVNCWGDLSFLGTSTNTNIKTAQTINGFGTGKISSLAVGFDFVCGITSPEKNVQCYGNNMYGQLGNNSTATFIFSGTNPVKIGSVSDYGSLDTVKYSSSLSTLTNVIGLTANMRAVCATTNADKDNTYCWGNVNGAPDINDQFNYFNLLGNGNYFSYCSDRKSTWLGFGCQYFSNSIAFASQPVLSNPVGLGMGTSSCYTSNPNSPSAVCNYDSFSDSTRSFMNSVPNLKKLSLGLSTSCGITKEKNSMEYVCWGVDLSLSKLQYCADGYFSCHGESYYHFAYGNETSNYQYDFFWKSTTSLNSEVRYKSQIAGSNGKFNVPISSITVGGLYSLTNGKNSLGTIFNFNSANDVQELQRPMGQICAALYDGSLYCWGGNLTGEVGNGIADLDLPSYTPVPSPTLILAPISSSLCPYPVASNATGFFPSNCGY
jgi:hypothetical protein